MMRDDGSSIEMMIGAWWRVTESGRLVAGPSIREVIGGSQECGG